MHNHTMKMKKIWNRLRKKPYRHSFMSASVDNSIEAQIFSLREQMGMTQNDLKQATGMGQSRISALENDAGSINLKTLKRFANAFDVALRVKFVPYSEFVASEVNEQLDRRVPSFSSDRLEGPEFQVSIVNECSTDYGIQYASGTPVNATMSGESNVAISV